MKCEAYLVVHCGGDRYIGRSKVNPEVMVPNRSFIKAERFIDDTKGLEMALDFAFKNAGNVIRVLTRMRKVKP